ncbi:MAG: ketopantoate reductase family protein [Halobacteriales archaeon]
MEIVVFGAGSLGSLVGGLLSRVHDVTLVGRPPHMDRVAEAGLRIGGLLDECVHPEARTDATGLTSDLALVTVKSYDTEAAAEALADGEHGAVCSLQNGLGNEEVLAEGVDAPVLGGTATYGADLVAPGEVHMTGRGDVTVGRFRGGDEALLGVVVSAFEVADVATKRTDDIRTQLWVKLAINAAINPVTALSRRRNGAVAEEPLAGVAMAAAREVELVAAVNEVDLAGPRVLSRVREVAAATAENRSSMLQDVLEEQRTEIDAINGAVVDRAGTVQVPVNEALTGLIRGWERGLDLR